MNKDPISDSAKVANAIRINWIGNLAKIPLLAVQILILLSVCFQLFLFKDNPHCSQLVSYEIVINDMDPVEEDHTIPIYRAPYAIPLRALFAIEFPVLLLLPFLLTLDRVRKTRLPIAFLLVIGLSISLYHIWYFLGGERAGEMHFVAALHTTIFIILIALLSRGKCRRAFRYGFWKINFGELMFWLLVILLAGLLMRGPGA